MREQAGCEKYMGRGGTRGHARRGDDGGMRKARDWGRHAEGTRKAEFTREGRNPEGMREGGGTRKAREKRAGAEGTRELVLDYIVHVYV